MSVALSKAPFSLTALFELLEIIPDTTFMWFPYFLYRYKLFLGAFHSPSLKVTLWLPPLKNYFLSQYIILVSLTNFLIWWKINGWFSRYLNFCIFDEYKNNSAIHQKLIKLEATLLIGSFRYDPSTLKKQQNFNIKSTECTMTAWLEIWVVMWAP